MIRARSAAAAWSPWGIPRRHGPCGVEAAVCCSTRSKRRTDGGFAAPAGWRRRTRGAVSASSRRRRSCGETLPYEPQRCTISPRRERHMSIEAVVLEKPRALSADKQQEVLGFLDSLEGESVPSPPHLSLQ